MYFKMSDEELRFNNSGPFFHLCTRPIEDVVVFASERDLVIVNNMIAISSAEFELRILAYAIMSNHLHFILEGTRTNCLAFFNSLITQLKRYLARHGRSGVTNRMEPSLLSIDDLRQLRNEIAYVIRNPFVVRIDVNPLAFQWCSGYLYFNPLIDCTGTPIQELSMRSFYELAGSKLTEKPSNSTILVKDGVANPASFVDYKRAMSFFENTRQFIIWVFKNVEGQVETAKRLGEMPHLNDSELLTLSFKLCKTFFRVPNIKELTEEKRKLLALRLKNDYGASNKQIARCTALSLSDVNAMFPLSAK